MTMAQLFGEADLQRVAGERSFGRGQGYLDAVGDLEIGVDQVTATVYGTDAYEVALDLAYRAALRADQKRKRNLIRLLDQRGL